LFALATSYIGQLKSKWGTLVSEESFHQKAPSDKTNAAKTKQPNAKDDKTEKAQAMKETKKKNPVSRAPTTNTTAGTETGVVAAVTTVGTNSSNTSSTTTPSSKNVNGTSSTTAVNVNAGSIKQPSTPSSSSGSTPPLSTYGKQKKTFSLNNNAKKQRLCNLNSLYSK
jgi:hypothetical protein